MSGRITGGSLWAKDHVFAEVINTNGEELDRLAELTASNTATMNKNGRVRDERIAELAERLEKLEAGLPAKEDTPMIIDGGVSDAPRVKRIVDSWNAKEHIYEGHDLTVGWSMWCSSDVQPNGKVNMKPESSEDDGGTPAVYCRDCEKDLEWWNEGMEWV